MTDRDKARLVGVHPDLLRAVGLVFAEMEQFGAPMFVVEGVRSAARQAVLYMQGRTTKGPIVTYDDGVEHRSKHQAHDDGFGYAVDCAFIDQKNPFAETHPWDVYGEAIERQGGIWGGRWHSIMDKPHFQWPDTSEKVLKA